MIEYMVTMNNNTDQITYIEHKLPQLKLQKAQDSYSSYSYSTLYVPLQPTQFYHFYFYPDRQPILIFRAQPCEILANKVKARVDVYDELVMVCIYKSLET